ncbi:HPP family protein [Pelagibacteraceae bacterium]|nr:HPP family protein [Pelagibacteraceae bacterium]
MNNNKIINALLSALGALIFISFLAFLDMSFEGMIWLIPPFGASMVLVMAVHESPLAKPKNILLGHILSALSGVIILYLIGDNFLALGIAVALAVFVMILTDTIHPPAGANPIIVILTGQGISFVLFPVAVGAFMLVVFAYLYNKLLKRNYP